MAAGRLARSFAWIVLVLLAAAPARAAGDAFLPLGPGARWEYSVHRDHSYRPDAGPADRTFRAGTRVLEYIAPREEGGEVRHELRDRRQETPTSPGLPPSLETSREIWSATRGVRIHAVEALGTPEVRFEPALQLLPPDVAVASRWRVGTWRTGELKMPLEAEALAREDVVLDDQRFEDCLRVRYDGRITGSIPVAGGRAEIAEARIERVAWWKEGIGAVREVTTIEGEIVLPDGKRAQISEVATFRLVQFQPPR